MKSRYLLASIIFVALAATQSRADTVLQFTGVTNSGVLDGTPLAAGTPFKVAADLDVPVLSTGIAVYSLKSLTATVGGVSYVASNPGDFHSVLEDPTSGSTEYFLDIYDLVFGMGLGPFFTATTPSGFSATAPTIPTQFSGFDGDFFGVDASLIINTGAHSLYLLEDESVGLTAELIKTSTSRVPEPSSGWLFGSLAFALIILRNKTRVVS